MAFSYPPTPDGDADEILAKDENQRKGFLGIVGKDGVLRSVEEYAKYQIEESPPGTHTVLANFTVASEEHAEILVNTLAEAAKDLDIVGSGALAALAHDEAPDPDALRSLLEMTTLLGAVADRPDVPGESL